MDVGGIDFGQYWRWLCLDVATQPPFLVSSFLVFPTLSSAQEIDLDIPSFDVSVSVDIPDAGSHVPEFTDFNDSDPGIASGISEALVTTAGGVTVDHTDEGLVIEIELPPVGVKPKPEKIKIGPIKTNLNPEFFNPDFLNPDIFIGDPFEAARPKVKEIVVVGSKVKEVIRSGLQQGRVLLDSDFGP